MSSHRSNLDALTGLRALAAFWVIAFHYRGGPFGPLGADQVLPVLGRGYLGVDLFFILSGFVIWHVHGEEVQRPAARTFLRFMCLRAARLYPTYLFTLLLLVLLLWIAPLYGNPMHATNYSWHELAIHVLLVQSWGFANPLTWNYPAWSVSAEWFCYLLLPLAAPAAGLLGRRGTVGAICVLLLAVTAIYLTVFDATMNQSSSALTLLRAAPEFILGCLLRRLTGQMPLVDRPWTLIVGAVAGLWTLSFFTPLPIGLLAIPLFACLILAGAASENAVARLLRLPIFVAIGEASYALYLMQAPVEKGAKVLRQYLSPAHPIQSTAIVVIYLTLLVVGTALAHRWVENPSRRWLRRVIDAKLPRRGPSGTADPRSTRQAFGAASKTRTVSLATAPAGGAAIPFSSTTERDRNT